MNLQARCDEAFQDFMNAVRDAWASSEIQEQGAASYLRYVQAFEKGLEPVAECWREYERVVQSPFLSGETRNRATDAYRNYLIAVQGAWADAEPDAVDAATLAAVCRDMLTVAWIAGSAASPPPATALDFQQAIVNPFDTVLG